MASDEFSLLQSQLQQTREALDASRAELRLATDRQRRIADAKAQLDRTFHEGDRKAVIERSRLEEQQHAAAKRVEELRGRTLEFEHATIAALEAFAKFSDPRVQLQRLDDAFPILLLPLRIETRFKQLSGRSGTTHQLWVRVYPDDCAVDTFEPTLSEAEVRNARRYWTEVWRAGDDEALQRAAWRNLVSSHGSGRALWIAEQYQPINGLTPPVDGTGEPEFPADDDESVRRRSWSRAPHVSVLPDRLVLMGYTGTTKVFEQTGNPIPSPLVVGPDPMADPADQIHQDGDDIAVSEEMRWLVDFGEAVDKGMGFRIDLTPEQFAAGFDRLLVLGVRMAADENAGRSEFEQLLRSHQHSRSGLALLRQGAPTNNTDDGDAAWSRSAAADASFAIMQSGGLFERQLDWWERTDGQWLAEMLGIDSAVLKRVEGANHKEVSEAQAMNLALFPATIGYFMDTMMSPVFDDADTEFVREFFTHFVSGRGMLSAIRIGQQPYGILPATVYSRMSWGRGNVTTHVPAITQVEKLHAILMRAHRAWGDLLNRVAYVGKPGDPHETLLHVLGLHASSMEFDQRWAESLEQVINRLNLQGVLSKLIETIRLQMQGTGLLAAHGHDPATDGRPDILDKFFLRTPTAIDAANLIHDQPLSEVDGIRTYTTDGRDYIDWLAEVAPGGVEPVRTHAGFSSAPTALLYRMLQHAVILGYHDAGVELHRRARDLPTEQVRMLRRDPAFIHVTEGKQSESRFQLLYTDSTVIGGNAKVSVADHIASRLGYHADVSRLKVQLDALQRLRGLPSARLERLFIEHLDTCSYRLDAWLQGLVQLRLAEQRGLDNEADPRQGLYLGAFGWLEDLRPSDHTRERVQLTDPDLVAAFDRPGDEPLMRDAGNAGFVHAPSPNHAVTAAVLRSGYRSTATPQDPGVLSVNLSSERVRRAMAVIEGIRNGQSLGALLGYQLERGLHDRHAEAEVDSFIFKLRKAFPLVADSIRETALPVEDGATDTEESIESIEARNVVDGVKLAEHIRKTGQRTYPFGKTWLPAASAAQRAVIDSEVARLLDTHDAVADVGIAEGIHHIAQGNYDRAAATMDAFTSGELPPIPDVVQTPRSGIGLTHRVGLHFRSGLSHTDSPVALPLTPRANAEPAVNHWLASLLPDSAQVGVLVEWSDGSGASGEKVVTQADLGLQPIDLLYLLNVEGEQAMSALDDRIILHSTAGRRPDVRARIRYTSRLATPFISLFEVGALISELRPLLLGARPLRATDIALPNEVDTTHAALPEYSTTRLAHVRAIITDAAGPREALRTLAAELQLLVDDAEVNRAALIAGIDGHIARFVAGASELGLSGVTDGGFGSVMDWKRERYSAVLTKVKLLLERWQERLDTFDALLNDYDFLPPATTDEARFEMLARIEALVAVKTTTPLPATPAAYRAALNTRRAAFDAKRGALAAVLGATTPDLAALLADSAAAAVDLHHFDTAKLELDAEENEVVRYSGDLLALTRSMVAEVDERVANADTALADYAVATTAAARETSFNTAAHALLGADFLTVPEFRMSNAQAAELSNAYDARGSLLDHLTDTLEIEFPVDEWLYGAARVRAPLQRWEAATMLTDALAQRELVLEPLQLPHHPGDSWLALEHPSTVALDTDRLLYTAHFAASFDAEAPQCGLLLDEWTEVIPAADETTGISFHYDRPNSEPPQVMLLATSPNLNGRWEWADLVDTLHETLDLAKRRAVEPDHLAGTDYARFLPATISAATMLPITIALNFAIANNVYQFVQTGESNG